MGIVSLTFLLLVVISILVFYLIDTRYRNLLLVFVSCIFVASYSYRFLIYILLFSLFNFLIGRLIFSSSKRKIYYWTGIIINLSQLLLIKYSSFTVDPIFAFFEHNTSISLTLSLYLVPIGISFFTLQGIGYLINLFKGWEKPESNFFNFFLYMIFYPKFLSGPIERSNKFLPQLKDYQPFDSAMVSDGLRIALFGFFKKIIIANQLGIIVTKAYADVDSSSSQLLWLIVLIQPLYLYFDFSGYTDIAIGLGKAYGIRLSPNFDRPFFSENVTTFWKRFHISLASWFNDYIFKQLSFKYRKWGNLASTVAVFITFTLFGIWHGAGWNFMFLGIFQAIVINFEFFTKKQRTAFFSLFPDYLGVWMGRMLTYGSYGLTLIFFFSSDISVSFKFISKLFKYGEAFKLGASKHDFLFVMFCAFVVLFIEFLQNDYQVQFKKLQTTWLGNRSFRLILYYAVIFLILYFKTSSNSFIYQQF